LPPSHPKWTAYEKVSLLVRNATTNLIVVWSIGWAVFGELGQAIGAVGVLIIAGEKVRKSEICSKFWKKIRRFETQDVLQIS
jgi:hypothetical protein